MADTIEFEKQNGVATIRLNRPDRYNAINRETALAIQEALDDCGSDFAIRAVFLTGKGKAFCAGQDLNELTGDHPPSMKDILREHYNPIITKIRHLPKPVICGVNGVAAGAGANMAIACDIVIAAASSSFIQAFSKIGLIPDSAGSFFLPRLIGFQRASSLMMLGDKLTAAEALQWGLVYKVFADDEFPAASLALATQLALMPTRALALTKQALNESFDNTLQQQLQLEDKLQTAAAETYDYREGVAAFISKRTPQFKGK